jgi:dihydroorotase-like cyclic amidohydrolase
MLDMIIKGGRVVTPAGVGNWDVGVVGEKIVAVAFPGILRAEAKHVVDAGGKIVVSGGIETHAHAVANGQRLGSPDDGQLIPRKIDPGVLRRPAF